MHYTQSKRGGARGVGLAVVIGLHAVVGWALANGGLGVVKNALEPITTKIVEEAPPPEEEPPPPPPTDIDLAPPPDMVILPEVTFDVPPPPTAIREVVAAKEITAPPPPRPAATPAPKPAGVRVNPKMPARFEKPPYPRESERLEQEGITTMRACIDAKGKVTSAEVTKSSGHPKLDEAAVEWLQKLRGIKAGTVDGVATDGMCMTVPLQWTIER